MTQGTQCFECGAPADRKHHVVPFSRGGNRTLPLCAACHRLAHDIRLSTLIREGKSKPADQRRRRERQPVVVGRKRDRDDSRAGESALAEATHEERVLRRAVAIMATRCVDAETMRLRPLFRCQHPADSADQLDGPCPYCDHVRADDAMARKARAMWPFIVMLPFSRSLRPSFIDAFDAWRATLPQIDGFPVLGTGKQPDTGDWPQELRDLWDCERVVAHERDRAVAELLEWKHSATMDMLIARYGLPEEQDMVAARELLAENWRGYQKQLRSSRAA